tara:strand:+ start:24639 stop:25778 length:1140 start_codon:yes stop_codon:yes gene_type:complete
MRLKLKNTPEQVELIKAMGSKDPAVAREASEAFAAFLGPVVRQVLMQANTSAGIYTDAPYDEDDNPSYPLDLYYNEGANMVQVWSQSMAGGLPTSHISGLEEMKIATYRLDSAVSMNKRYARKARLDVVSKGVERMANEILVKQDRNAWAVILKALAEASTGGNQHLLQSQSTAGATPAVSQFTLEDLNDCMQRMARINESYAGGTPAEAYSKGITDLYVSPKVMADIRAFSYTALGGSSAGQAQTDLPDSIRSDIYRAAGAGSIFGVNIHQLLELGPSEKYQVLLNTFTGATTYTNIDGGGALPVDADDSTIVGIDNSKGAFVRPVARGEGGETFTAVPDDQFYAARMEKLGFYGFLEEGRVCLDSRAIVGINMRDDD